jgi:antitoxin component of MazEF toxin-antitoxin module
LYQDTSKRAVFTFPAFIREHLGLKNGDEVAVEFGGDMIKVKPTGKESK